MSDLKKLNSIKTRPPFAILDIAVYVALVVLVASLFVIFFTKDDGAYAYVYTIGVKKERLVLDLSKDSVHTVFFDKNGDYIKYEIGDKSQEIAEHNAANATNIYQHLIVVVQNGAVKVTYSDCYDHICVNQGFIRSSGFVITCLPFKTSVVVKSRTATDDPIKVG